MVIVPLSPETQIKDASVTHDAVPQRAETPTPARRHSAPTGPDRYAFHRHVLQHRYEASRRYGEERAQRPPDTVGNIFGAQPPQPQKKG